MYFGFDGNTEGFEKILSRIALNHDQEGCGVWGCRFGSGKNAFPHPTGTSPFFLNMEKRKRCIARHQEGCGVWGCRFGSGKNAFPHPTGTSPFFLNMEKRKRCIARHQEGCGVWGCRFGSGKNAFPHPTGTSPFFLNMGFPTPHTLSPTPCSCMCKKYSVHFETPFF